MPNTGTPVPAWARRAPRTVPIAAEGDAEIDLLTGDRVGLVAAAITDDDVLAAQRTVLVMFLGTERQGHAGAASASSTRATSASTVSSRPGGG